MKRHPAIKAISFTPDAASTASVGNQHAMPDATELHIPCSFCGRPLTWLNARWTCLRCDP